MFSQVQLASAAVKFHCRSAENRIFVKEYTKRLLKMSFVVRKALKEDCSEIIRLIQELADYEKMPDGPKIDANVLEQDGFGPRSFFECNVIQCSGESSVLLGYVLFFYSYSTWEGKSVYMEDLYVTPSHRGKGLGTRLWQSCVKAGLEENCSRCNFSVLNWNKPSIDFYKSKGAIDLTSQEGWLAFRLNRPQMEAFVNEK